MDAASGQRPGAAFGDVLELVPFRYAKSNALEVIRNADDRIVYVVVTSSAEVGIAEGRSFVNEATVFDSNIEAWADFVRNAPTIQGTHIRIARESLEGRL